MFKMMIVDDEPIIRQGIKTSIEWSSYGINVVAEAGNGREALKKVLEYKPDILLTDIRMPVMNGLELAEEINNRGLDTLVIILSGYDDFEYARTSIKLNVVDYLLKPIGAEDLISVVNSVKDKIIYQQQQMEEHLVKEIVMEENIGIIQSTFIQNLLKRNYNDYSYIYNKAETIEIDLSGPLYQILLIDIDDYYMISEKMSENEKELLINTIINLSEQKINENYSGITCRSDSDYLISLINLSYIKELSIDFIRELRDTISKNLNLSITISIGSKYDDISLVSNSYKEAVLALRKKIYRGKGSIINFTELKDDEKSRSIFYPDKKEKELLHGLRFLNKSSISRIIEKLFDKFSAEMVSYPNIKNTTLRIILMAQGQLEEMGINVEKEFKESFKPYDEIEKYETIIDIKLWLKDLLFEFIEIIKQNKSKHYNKIITTVLQYVKDNYNHDISLKNIARIVYVTPNYFSKIFKEEMGENFTNWLNKYRIEQAKNIIKKDKDIKFYQISEMVGFNDYKYFSKIFKKFTGQTPSQYKNKI